LLRFARNDAYLYLPAARKRPSAVKFFSLDQEGAGNAGRVSAPAASYAKVESIRVSHHRFAETFRHSLHDGVTAYFALSLVIGLVVTIASGSGYRLDISVEISGPHDFAVRDQRVRLQRKPRPSHPAPNVRDDRDTPLFSGAEWREVVKVICPSAQGEVFEEEDDQERATPVCPDVTRHSVKPRSPHIPSETYCPSDQPSPDHGQRPLVWRRAILRSQPRRHHLLPDVKQRETQRS
jgi:hypothetical protein